jgi:zeaxanthin glucosyltransferase
MLCIGRELKRRGHGVTHVGAPETRAKTLEAGLDFLVCEYHGSQDDRLADLRRRLKSLRAIPALKQTLAIYSERIGAMLKNVPGKLKQAGVEALLIDQSLPVGSIADHLKIPFVSVCCAMPFIPDDTVPPLFTGWKYNHAWWARLRNRACYAYYRRLTMKIARIVAEYRRERDLPPYTSYRAVDSQLAVICQQPAEFEYPRKNLPGWFHFVGPYRRSNEADPAPFPWERLSKKPLVYASMGTVQNRIPGVFHAVAAACSGMDVQLVISLGNRALTNAPVKLPGNPLAFGWVPQTELLKRAALTVTHAGMNTTLECLSNAVPMVAVPISNDQPGVAARIAWTGTGEVVPLRIANASRLQRAICRVLASPRYKRNALRLQKAIEHTGGVARAADIIEQAVYTGKPVLRIGADEDQAS